MYMFKSSFDDESFSTVKDAVLHRAIMTECMFESSILSGISISLFIILIGQWQDYALIDWHLIGLVIPLNIVVKASNSKQKAIKAFQNSKE